MHLLFFTALFMTVYSEKAKFNEDLDSVWNKFKDVHQLNYDEVENLYRRHIFEKRVDKIAKHNLEADLGLHTFKIGLNRFSDWDPQELKKIFSYKKTPLLKSSVLQAELPNFSTPLPDKVDWREKGYVTDVKDAGECGACWALTVTGSLEGQHKKQTGKLVALSAQNLVDCVHPGGACEGGSIELGYEYVIKNKGIDTEEYYPYTGGDGTCHFSKDHIGATCTSYVELPQGDEEELKKAVAYIGPISAAIDASQLSFQLYTEGIYESTECSSVQLDHAVLIVGYGTENGVDYWLIRNCWGKSWGMNGYIKMRRNYNNMCGVASSASYPVV